MGRPKEFDRSEVLRLAGDVFCLKGFADTSISDLEKATGLNKSSLYAEFKDKNELFVSTLKLYMAEDDSLQQLSKHPLGWANIEEFFALAHSCQSEEGCYAVMSLRETAIIPDEASLIMKSHFNQMRELLEKNLDADGFGSNARILADQMVTFVLGTSLEQNLTGVKEVHTKLVDFLNLVSQLRPKK